MQEDIFFKHSIFSTLLNKINISNDKILSDFNNNRNNYTFTHFINNRWENIYISPDKIPSIIPLLKEIMNIAINQYQNKIKPHQTLIIPHELLGYKKNEFWFNLALPGESTSTHNHNSKAIASGVYYLDAPKNCGNIVFINEKKEVFEMEPKPGKLILFPCEIDHFVNENKSTNKRISIAFNCYLFPLMPSAKEVI